MAAKARGLGKGLDTLIPGGAPEKTKVNNKPEKETEAEESAAGDTEE